MADILLRIMRFIRIYQIIRLDENLVIHPVHIRQGMMMPYQIDNAFRHILQQATVRQKLPRQNSPLLLLVFSVGIPVFFSAQRAGDVVEDRRDLYDPFISCLLLSSPFHAPLFPRVLSAPGPGIDKNIVATLSCFVQCLTSSEKCADRKHTDRV